MSAGPPPDRQTLEESAEEERLQRLLDRAPTDSTTATRRFLSGIGALLLLGVVYEQVGDRFHAGIIHTLLVGIALFAAAVTALFILGGILKAAKKAGKLAVFLLAAAAAWYAVNAAGARAARDEGRASVYGK